MSHVVDMPLHIREADEPDGSIDLQIEPADGAQTLIHVVAGLHTEVKRGGLPGLARAAAAAASAVAVEYRRPQLAGDRRKAQGCARSRRAVDDTCANCAIWTRVSSSSRSTREREPSVLRRAVRACDPTGTPTAPPRPAPRSA